MDFEDHNRIDNRNKSRIKDRSIDELIGICKGILFDGAVSTGEAQHLLTWMQANPVIAEDWFGRDLYQRLLVFLEDGVIDEREEAVLLDLLNDITGRSEINVDGQNAATTLPLCPDPPTEIIIDGCHFALTGNFAYGKRKDVEKLIIDNGGFVKKNPNRKCHYLVIGDVGSNAWMHSSFGRKIEEAVTVRDGGHSISIITEAHFFEHIIIEGN
ncbi:BRCT domain-containing protein [Methylophaga sp. OBS4]|uniref:BRCT domain-containing protein n=1 Tax=Methylophaga sp. OBS4 TaxID=2991935 RepID=UPI002258D60F|nr:BRCT domain-containing protein [Methylophaga sp. OBS4]MCX4187149.1 BRCT domain-containing protein [Methylophaga sp. OBS4]